MQSAGDRLLLLICCLVVLPIEADEATTVAALLCAITIVALNGYSSRDVIVMASTILYTLFCIVRPRFITFLPLVHYDAMTKIQKNPFEQPDTRLLYLDPPPPAETSKRNAWPIWASLITVGVIVSLVHLSLQGFLVFSALTAVSYVLASRQNALEYSRSQANRLRDDSYEKAMLLAQRNRELLENQDYEVRLATLNERGRIAREIHDHVGHLLSRLILQIGALIVTEEDEEKRRDLSVIRETLSQAMDSIRASVRNLHDESIDLKTQVEAIVEDFTFCPIRLDYRLEDEPEKAIAYCFIAVIKEALSNVIHHSDATLVTVILVEHPALYQLIVQDNGTELHLGSGEGLGLLSIEDRVRALGGQFVIEHKSGFRLFISVPKRR